MVAAVVEKYRKKKCRRHDETNGRSNQYLLRAERITFSSRFDLPFKRFSTRQWNKESGHDLSRLTRLFFCIGRTADVQPLHTIAQGMTADFQMFSGAADAKAALLQR